MAVPDSRRADGKHPYYSDTETQGNGYLRSTTAPARSVAPKYTCPVV